MFGHLFPPSFKNWWSDDWISTVYGLEHTFRLAHFVIVHVVVYMSELIPLVVVYRVLDVDIKHNVGAQKTKGETRYEVDKVGTWCLS